MAEPGYVLLDPMPVWSMCVLGRGVCHALALLSTSPSVLPEQPLYGPVHCMGFATVGSMEHSIGQHRGGGEGQVTVCCPSPVLCRNDALIIWDAILSLSLSLSQSLPAHSTSLGVAVADVLSRSSQQGRNGTQRHPVAVHCSDNDCWQLRPLEERSWTCSRSPVQASMWP
jgi:hypothetical protein